MSTVPPLSGPPLYRYIPGVGKVASSINGPTGPQGPQGIAGGAANTGATGGTGQTGPAGFQTFTTTEGSILYYSGTGVTGRANFTLTDSTLQIPGSMIPSANNTYSLGATGARWKDVLIGPGSINIAGPPGFTGSATIGTDAAGLVYTEGGFASPKIVIGPGQLTPQALGGWQIGPTGTQGQPGYSLIVQELQANGSGPTGPIYTIAPGPVGFTGPTGSIGPASTVTGPTGSSVQMPSSFASSGTGITLATGPTGTNLASSTLVTTQTGYIWSTSSVELLNNDNTNAQEVTLYQIVNGYTSDGMRVTIQRRTGTVGTYQVVSLSTRSDAKVPPGSWPIEVYGYTTASTTNVSAIHRDTFAIGHLG